MNVSSSTSFLPNLLSSVQNGFQNVQSQAASAGAQLESGNVDPESAAELQQVLVLAKANKMESDTTDQMIGSLLNTKA